MLKVKIINTVNDYDATRAVNEFLVYIDENDFLVMDIIYKPIGHTLGGYNCIMIKYKEL